MEPIIKIEHKGDHLLLQSQQLPTPSLVEPKGYALSGSIDAPYEYLSKYPLINSNPCIMFVDRPMGRIALEFNKEFSERWVSVLGKVTPNPVFAALGVNKEKKYPSSKDLARVLKPLASYFLDPREFSGILAAETQIKAKISGDINEQNSKRGFKSSSNSMQVEIEGLLSSFQLRIPIHVGGPDHDLTIQLFYEPSANGGYFMYLECLELWVLETQEREALIDEQLEKLAVYELPIINIVD